MSDNLKIAWSPVVQCYRASKLTLEICLVWIIIYSLRMEYDKLAVNNEVYSWSEALGEVVLCSSVMQQCYAVVLCSSVMQ